MFSYEWPMSHKIFFGVGGNHNPKGFYLCHRKYVLEIIEDTSLIGSKPVDFQMEQHHKLVLTFGTPLEDTEPYQRLIKWLVHLFMTRLSLAYFVHILSQFMQNPCKDH